MKTLPRTSPEVLAEILADQEELWLGDTPWRVANLLNAYIGAHRIATRAMNQRLAEGENPKADPRGQKVRSVDIVLAVQRHFVEEIMLAVRR